MSVKLSEDKCSPLLCSTDCKSPIKVQPVIENCSSVNATGQIEPKY